MSYERKSITKKSECFLKDKCCKICKKNIHTEQNCFYKDKSKNNNGKGGKQEATVAFVIVCAKAVPQNL